MEDGSSNSSSAPKRSELEALQKEHEEKGLKIQELKRQIEATKHLLENKKKEVPEEQKEAFNNLCKKYNTMKDEYQALLAKKSRKRSNAGLDM